MTMADLVVVMGEGQIRQAAAPIEIYRRPSDTFVADFIGSTNLLDVARDRAGRALVAGVALPGLALPDGRSEEHTSELQSLMRISYAVFCLKKKKQKTKAYPIPKKKSKKNKTASIANNQEWIKYNRNK